MAIKYSDSVLEALKYFNLDKVPQTMKELNLHYRKLSLKVGASRQEQWNRRIQRTVSVVTNVLESSGEPSFSKS